MARVTLTIAIHFRWWVNPLLGCMKALLWCGATLDLKRCGRFLARGAVFSAR